ncbi:hypothetical protein C8F01DRAFT_101251 [Mycena amicta]|nr:hypothetical protein C8F01DRAFT_101251 [Mycena amicta]
MPSTSTVVLPSIHEMFPEYLMPASKPVRGPTSAGPTPFLGSLPPRNHYLPSSMPSPLTLRFSFDSQSTVTPSAQSTASTLRSPTSTGTDNDSRELELEEAESASDGLTSESGDADADESGSQPGSSNHIRKHVCLQCRKRFNRPSSLRIHVNTHTGATPFHCPYPNCGRAFNVNSNMRRHYRNHSVALSAAAGAVSARPGSSCASTFSACSSLDLVNPASSSSVTLFSPKTRPDGVNPHPGRAHPYHLRRAPNSPPLALPGSPRSNPSTSTPSPRSDAHSPRESPVLLLTPASWDAQAQSGGLCSYEESALRGVGP